ncbi:hypothetical protein ERHA54_35340 [Erwinia rhapontici]|uniref:hypothetical protein n=1 Tax=Erwinia rhapontici TaxID=55212 RepID=UPI001BB30E26|nr:hypothetical protein [Erwinia rhapontici]BCQ40931.1 hypothetical protein ERHA54_35340 [Erwinia rhapontici]
MEIINFKQTSEDASIKSDQLLALLMILGSGVKDIEDEEMMSAIFLARNLAQEIDSFLETIRKGKS